MSAVGVVTGMNFVFRRPCAMFAARMRFFMISVGMFPATRRVAIIHVAVLAA